MKLNLTNPNQLAAAERAIKGFQTRGEVEFAFDPHNQEQIRTYMQLRQINMRSTAQQLATVMKNEKTEVTQGGAMRFHYWGVPKNNFPKGLPAKLQESELPTDQVKDYMIMGGATIDTDVYYILDCEVQRSELGKNVVTFEFVSQNTTKRKHKDMLALSGAASSAGAAAPTPAIPAIKDGKDKKEESEGAASAAERTHLGRSAGACQDQDNKNGKEKEERALGRRCSDASETADDQNPPEKQAKTMLSTMKILKDSLYQAMDKGLWEAISPLHQDNVKHLLDELIAVLVDMKTFKPAAEVSALASKVARWLINEILGRPVFANLHIFKNCAISKLLEGELAEGIDRSTFSDNYCTVMVKLTESLAG